MSNTIVCGLQKPFREVSESGYVYFNFGDETVQPIDAPESYPAGSMKACIGPDLKDYPLQSSIWRGK